MKLLTFLMTILLTASINAATFSAFADGDNLYVTVLLDSCNSHGLGLDVDGICRSDRMTANYATECGASLSIRSTKMACFDMTLEAQTFKISLKESKVAPEAEVLTLRRYNGEQISIDIDRK